MIKKMFAKLAVLTAMIGTVSGCATLNLLNNPSDTDKTTKTILTEDYVVAFGSPAKGSMLPEDNVVVVGEKHSYVLSDGGNQLVNLLNRLDPKNIHVDSDLNFFSEKNDGMFLGQINLSYAKPKDEVTYQDRQFFLQNNGTECTTKSDERINAQRFCFALKINGKVYPQVSNFQAVRTQYKPLSRPYQVAIYTIENKATTDNSKLCVGKLVLFPFALAFDVVTLPFQIFKLTDY